MILALDIGNSQIFCGVFDREELKVQVRYASKAQISSDEFGVFLRGALRENGVDPDSIRTCLLYTSPSPRDKRQSRMPSSA